MKRLFGRRPSPAMVVAVIACVLGLAGQGVAQPVVETAANASKDVLKLSKSANKRSKSALRTARRADKNAKAALAKGGPKGDKGDKGDQGDPGVPRHAPERQDAQGQVLRARDDQRRRTRTPTTRSRSRIRLRRPLTSSHSHPAGHRTANCPGANRPQAAPGNVCVYSVSRADVNTSFSSDGIEFDQHDKYGFALNVNSSTSSAYFLRQSARWAVTAP